ncbi:hypothetical protein CHLNCDRAFT_52521 [Chlorella variabilis]|uniref:Uncharacterized protein n=1 Tax=Chlorella variabilis TaxID=554065 RepID=E1ZFR2_CHLVA|nr:hypothetical protein CHLNCDRAFT_52521 [Chlorella variabilis]EFN55324.1 hypothetical protein CHLNCDRAFT_52521 [Chlorella variabilis]|eukprot:XP_005847426.1 hypothetical protein CHLNCDRAFT_52521 [Chlorella variabilis]
MEKLGLEKLRLGSSKLAPKHQRNPTLGARAAAVSVLNPPPPPGLLLKSFHSRSCADYSPLAKSVPAFSPEALADSQVLQEGRTAASPARGDRIPAKHAEAPPPRRDQGSLERRDSLAPAGSAWNPWQGHAEALPLPARRVAAHKPNPSWFAPVVGFGGPPSVVWEQQQQQPGHPPPPAQQQQQQQQHCDNQVPPTEPQMSEPVRDSRQLHPGQHRQHSSGEAAPPLLPSSAAPAAPAELACAGPLASQLGRLQQESTQVAIPQQEHPTSQPSPPPQPQQHQRSPPWYQQGWQQASQRPPAQQLPSSRPAQGMPGPAGLYPGGNPFACEAVQLDSMAAAATMGAPPAAPHQQARPPRQPAPARSSAGGAAGSAGRKLPPPPRFLLARASQPTPTQECPAAQPQPHGSPAAKQHGHVQREHAAAPAPAAVAPAAPPPQVQLEADIDVPPASHAQQPSVAQQQRQQQHKQRAAAAVAAAASAAAASCQHDAPSLKSAPTPPPPPPPLPPTVASASATAMCMSGTPSSSAPAAASTPAAGGSLLSAIKPAELLAAAGKLRRVGASGGSSHEVIVCLFVGLQYWQSNLHNTGRATYMCQGGSGAAGGWCLTSSCPAWRVCKRLSVGETVSASFLVLREGALAFGTDCAARLKRKRLHASNDSRSEASSAGRPAGGPAAPHGAGPPPAPLEPSPAGVPWAASFLFDYVHQRAFLRRDRSGQAALVRERLLAGALLAASLWIAIKFEATRTTTPDANLMSRISGIPAGLLRQQERQILADLGWDLMTLAREAGAVALPDPTDAGCLDQQQQLAALAAPLITNCKPEAPPARAAMLAGPQARPQPLAQPLVCNNLLAQPEEHDDCFPAMPGGSHMQGCLGRVPTSGLAALGW